LPVSRARQMQTVAVVMALAGLPVSGLAAVSQRAVALVRSAETHLAANRAAEAVEQLQQAASIEPEWYVPPSRLAIAYQMCDMESAALQQYVRVQQISFAHDPNGSEFTPEVQQLLAEAEGYMTLLINRTRRGEQLRPLYPHHKMAIVGRQHAREMRDKGYFSHISPTPSRRTVVDRFRLVFSFRPRVVAENLSRRWRRGYGYTLSLAKVDESYEDLLASPGHRSNIVLPELTNIGIGIVVNEEGDYWLAQIFADLRGHPEY